MQIFHTIIISLAAKLAEREEWQGHICDQISMLTAQNVNKNNYKALSLSKGGQRLASELT